MACAETPANKRTSLVAVEPTAGDPDATKRRQAETGQRQGVSRQVDDRPQEFRGELVYVAHKRPNSRRHARPSAPPRPVAVAATDRSSTTARPPSSGWAIGASGWTSSTPRAARSIVVEERRGDGQRQDRRAHVVTKAGQRELGGPRPATGLVRSLVDPDRAPGTGQRYRGGEAVRPRPDHDRVELGCRWPSSRPRSHGRTTRPRSQNVAVIGSTAPTAALVSSVPIVSRSS